jgi:hypothetical protein
MVEYSSESLDDEEADMCVAEWSRGGGSKSKPFICSSLKPASKSRQDEMCYTFNVTKCYGIFDYLLQENKLNYQVIMSYHRRNSSKSMLITNEIILILMVLTITIFFVDKFNRP